jgi:hypothetical protein
MCNEKITSMEWSSDIRQDVMTTDSNADLNAFLKKNSKITSCYDSLIKTTWQIFQVILVPVQQKLQ